MFTGYLVNTYCSQLLTNIFIFEVKRVMDGMTHYFCIFEPPYWIIDQTQFCMILAMDLEKNPNK